MNEKLPKLILMIFLVAEKTKEIEKVKQEMESKLAEAESKEALETDAEQSKKEESDLAKKMLQNQIAKLKQELTMQKEELAKHS